ncbi:MAG: FtsX-like permease family protein [Chloroflexota bacterium]|nr:FtsX-like permease family protein [Chloroflexota bacterium]
MTFAFYARYARRALLRDGQRTLLALVCIAFGVMSLVGMQLLSNMIHAAVVTDPRSILDGDAVISHRQGDLFTAQDLDQLSTMKADGRLLSYSLMSQGDTRWLKPPGTGKVYLLTGQTRGVDPAHFPQIGTIHISTPQGASFSDRIKTPLDMVITSDVADKLNLKIGDAITLIGNPTGEPATLRLAGIADNVPGSRGDSAFYSIETASKISGQSSPSNMASLVWGARGPQTVAFNSESWHMQTVADEVKNAAQVADLFGFMLKGAGIMGLLVGGIGIANTLQVVLARRMLEIATLKTLGYRRRDLLFLFGIETALLGLIGGIVGVVLALGLALLLMNLMGHLGALLLNWSADPLVMLGGILTGVLTAVIFGLYTIVRASSVRPAVLLRELPARLTVGARIASAGLTLLLLALFTGISVLIMGKLIDGIAVVAAALVGLVVLTLLMGAALLAGMSLPTPGMPLLTMARRNLRRKPMRSVFALIALFCGVFAIGLSGSVLLNARDRLAARQTPADGLNITLYGKRADSAAITAQLAAYAVENVQSSVRLPAAVSFKDVPLPGISSADGRESTTNSDIQVVSGQLAGDRSGLLPAQAQQAPLSIKQGDLVVVTVAASPGNTGSKGTTSSVSIRVSGFYSQTGRGEDARKHPTAIILTAAAALRLGGPATSLVYTGHVPLSRLSAATNAIGQALPQAIVVSQADLNDARNHIFEGLFAFAAGLAGLALVAGAILIANAVGLAMVERRREMGILKAVGFTSNRVLSTLLAENALMGLIAGVLGMAGVALAMLWINNAVPQALLSFDPVLAVEMVGIAVALALLSAVAVAWRPTHVRPLDVLRNE